MMGGVMKEPKTRRSELPSRKGVHVRELGEENWMEPCLTGNGASENLTSPDWYQGRLKMGGFPPPELQAQGPSGKKGLAHQGGSSGPFSKLQGQFSRKIAWGTRMGGQWRGDRKKTRSSWGERGAKRGKGDLTEEKFA